MQQTFGINLSRRQAQEQTSDVAGMSSATGGVLFHLPLKRTRPPCVAPSRAPDADARWHTQYGSGRSSSEA